MLAVVALMFGATGCLVIPTPHSDSGYARTNVNQHAQEQFVPGKTTREDVIVALGEPDAVSMDEHHLAYRSEKVVALWIVGGGYSATGGTIYKNRFYVFEFDSQGRFQTVRQTGQLGMVEGAHEPQLANPALSLASSSSTVANVSRSAFWMRDINGFQGLKGQFSIGKAGQLMLTESNLVFSTESQFADAEPELKLPLTSITNVCVAKSSFLRRLVVQTDAGKIHSFEIVKPSGLGGVWQDKPAMQAACDFIQSRIKPTRPES
jgi:outer membrane protein assembly factor BamE (lipoprotein component of BamABCDE complex)